MKYIFAALNDLVENLLDAIHLPERSKRMLKKIKSLTDERKKDRIEF